MTRILLFIFLLLPSVSLAIGGTGASCNPAEPAWGSCSLTEPSWASSVTSTVDLPTGTWTSAYAASSANTRYRLQGDVTANGTGIIVSADYVIVDLNGYTLTYNETTAGAGVTLGAWNLNNVAIINGSIVQGAAQSAGDVYSRSVNPITTYNSADGANYSCSNAFMANLSLTYGGKDTGGIYWNGSGTYEQITTEDTYEFGTLANRHQGVDAIHVDNGNAKIIRNNTITNARQRGINSNSSAEIYGNYVDIRSIATNSVGISGYAAQNLNVYSNTVYGRGEHPIGISFGGGADNIDIFDNDIDVQITALGEEYGSSYLANPSQTYGGNFAAGYRTTWGSDNVNFYNNEITVTTNSNYTGTYSPTGDVAYIDGGGKGLFVGLSTGETSIFANNTITMADADGTGRQYGIACSYNFSERLWIYGNTVTADVNNLALGDQYGGCEGYPLFEDNTFIKSGAWSSYLTVKNGYGGYFDSTGRMVDNVYSSGASITSRNFYPESTNGTVDVYYGSESGGTDYYSYRLHDSNNTASTIQQEDFDPVTTLAYAVPNETTITCYPDTDSDGYGDSADAGTARSSCNAGEVTNKTDCDDTLASVYPGATETCGDAIDQDCNGSDLSCTSPVSLTPQAGTLTPQAGTLTVVTE